MNFIGFQYFYIEHTLEGVEGDLVAMCCIVYLSKTRVMVTIYFSNLINPTQRIFSAIHDGYDSQQ